MGERAHALRTRKRRLTRHVDEEKGFAARMRANGITLAPRAFVRSALTREDEAVPILDEARASVALIAEDDEDLLEMMCYGLREWGFRVIGARDGQLALDAFREKRPDIALLDVGLPHVSGTEICRAIRDLGS